MYLASHILMIFNKKALYHLAMQWMGIWVPPYTVSLVCSGGGGILRNGVWLSLSYVVR
jgi:hypothetical protein